MLKNLFVNLKYKKEYKKLKELNKKYSTEIDQLKEIKSINNKKQEHLIEKIRKLKIDNEFLLGLEKEINLHIKDYSNDYVNETIEHNNEKYYIRINEKVDNDFEMYIGKNYNLNYNDYISHLHIIQITKTTYMLIELDTHEDYRKKGFASILLNSADKYLIERNVEELKVELCRDELGKVNEYLIRFYEKNGFHDGVKKYIII